MFRVRVKAELWLVKRLIHLLWYVQSLSLKRIERGLRDKKERLVKEERAIRLIKQPYSGKICDVCGIIVKGGHKGAHLKSHHPRYEFTVKRVGSNLVYVCRTCFQTTGGVKGVVKHYQSFHPDVV